MALFKAWQPVLTAGASFVLGWAGNKTLDTFYDGAKKSYESPPTLPSEQEKQIARLKQDLEYSDRANQFHRNELAKQEKETIRWINNYEDLKEKYEKQKF